MPKRFPNQQKLKTLVKPDCMSQQQPPQLAFSTSVPSMSKKAGPLTATPSSIPSFTMKKKQMERHRRFEQYRTRIDQSFLLFMSRLQEHCAKKLTGAPPRKSPESIGLNISDSCFQPTVLTSDPTAESEHNFSDFVDEEAKTKELRNSLSNQTPKGKRSLIPVRSPQRALSFSFPKKSENTFSNHITQSQETAERTFPIAIDVPKSDRNKFEESIKKDMYQSLSEGNTICRPMSSIVNHKLPSNASIPELEDDKDNDVANFRCSKLNVDVSVIHQDEKCNTLANPRSIKPKADWNGNPVVDQCQTQINPRSSKSKAEGIKALDTKLTTEQNTKVVEPKTASIINFFDDKYQTIANSVMLSQSKADDSVHLFADFSTDHTALLELSKDQLKPEGSICDTDSNHGRHSNRVSRPEKELIWKCHNETSGRLNRRAIQKALMIVQRSMRSVSLPESLCGDTFLTRDHLDSTSDRRHTNREITLTPRCSIIEVTPQPLPQFVVPYKLTIHTESEKSYTKNLPTAKENSEERQKIKQVFRRNKSLIPVREKPAFSEEASKQDNKKPSEVTNQVVRMNNTMTSGDNIGLQHIKESNIKNVDGKRRLKSNYSRQVQPTDQQLLHSKIPIGDTSEPLFKVNNIKEAKTTKPPLPRQRLRSHLSNVKHTQLKASFKNHDSTKLSPPKFHGNPRTHSSTSPSPETHAPKRIWAKPSPKKLSRKRLAAPAKIYSPKDRCKRKDGTSMWRAFSSGSPSQDSSVSVLKQWPLVASNDSNLQSIRSPSDSSPVTKRATSKYSFKKTMRLNKKQIMNNKVSRRAQSQPSEKTMPDRNKAVIKIIKPTLVGKNNLESRQHKTTHIYKKNEEKLLTQSPDDTKDENEDQVSKTTKRNARDVKNTPVVLPTKSAPNKPAEWSLSLESIDAQNEKLTKTAAVKTKRQQLKIAVEKSATKGTMNFKEKDQISLEKKAKYPWKFNTPYAKIKEDLELFSSHKPTITSLKNVGTQNERLGKRILQEDENVPQRESTKRSKSFNDSTEDEQESSLSAHSNESQHIQKVNQHIQEENLEWDVGSPVLGLESSQLSSNAEQAAKSSKMVNQTKSKNAAWNINDSEVRVVSSKHSTRTIETKPSSVYNDGLDNLKSTRLLSPKHEYLGRDLRGFQRQISSSEQKPQLPNKEMNRDVHKMYRQRTVFEQQSQSKERFNIEHQKVSRQIIPSEGEPSREHWQEDSCASKETPQARDDPVSDPSERGSSIAEEGTFTTHPVTEASYQKIAQENSEEDDEIIQADKEEVLIHLYQSQSKIAARVLGIQENIKLLKEGLVFLESSVQSSDGETKWRGTLLDYIFLLTFMVVQVCVQYVLVKK